VERWVARRWASIPVRLVVVPGGLRGINNAHSEMQCAHAEATMISFCTVFAYASAWDARQAKRCAMRRCRDKLWVKIRYINFLQKSRHFIFLSNSAHWVILIPFSSFYLYRVFLTQLTGSFWYHFPLSTCTGYSWHTFSYFGGLLGYSAAVRVLCSCGYPAAGYSAAVRVLCSC